MNTESEKDLFIRYGTFEGLYEFKRSDGIHFYVDEEEQERLTSLRAKEGKKALLIGRGTFKELYKFERSNGVDFYVTRVGMKARLKNLLNFGEPCDQTERALELHPLPHSIYNQ